MKRDEYNGFLRKVKCSDEFRSRMQEKLSSPIIEIHEYADSVSGTEVITARHSWGRFAAAAAALVLVCGAVGGGAYQLSRMNGSSMQGSSGDSISTDNIDLNAPIYDNIKANKELYSGDITLVEDTDVMFRNIGSDIEPFIDCMDQFNMSNEIDQEDFIESARSITINFYEKERNEEIYAVLKQRVEDIDKIGLYYDTFYTFTLYENGCYTMTDNKAGRTTYHEFVEGDKVFHDILNMYADEATIEIFDRVTHKELESEIMDGFRKGTYDRAYYYIADENRQEEYTVTGREEFANELMAFEWERAPIRSGDVNSYDFGFVAAEDGYMQFGIGRTYKLKNESDLEAYNDVLKKHLIKNN